jgi:hypothetical protein
MKRILSFIFVIFAALSLCAKDNNYIENDNIDTEGWRIISSVYENLYSGWTTAASASLVTTIAPGGDTTMFLKLCLNEGKLTIDEGSALLLKLGNGNTLELKSNKVGLADYNYYVSKFGTSYFVYPTYVITEEQIQEIIDNDVVKIRIQWTGGTIDKEIKKKKLSKMLSHTFPALKAAAVQQKSIYDDF